MPHIEEDTKSAQQRA